jgi:ubiquinone/menaquinone biosynthesis C-methylase UbiE
MKTDHNITHKTISSFEEAFAQIENKIKERGDLPYLKVKDQMALLRELGDFGLGRFLIQHQGLNGYWTDYIIHHYPSKTLIESPLEKFLLENAPVFLATQERFKIFKEHLQNEVREGVSFASLPCGLMGDLLDLDFSGIDDYTLIGIDIDPESLKLAAQIGNSKTQFVQADAWNLQLPSPVDVLTSNGLNVYEPDDDKVLALYKSFYEAIKPSGILITSFLTPQDEWKMDQIPPGDLKLQKIIFSDILAVGWQTFRSTTKTLGQLKLAGFKEVEFIYDKASIFPTAIARK